MAGVAGKSGGPRKNAGGARPGAGRKPKATQEPTVTAYADPLDFLRAVWTGKVQATAEQVGAAKAALPFAHQRLGEGGKKEARADAAKKAENKFARTTPPKLKAVK